MCNKNRLLRENPKNKESKMKQKGFTLLEVLITTAIMISVLAAVAYGLSQSSNLAETMRNQDIAINAAKDILEQIIQSDLNDIMNNYDGQNFPIADVQGNALLTAPAGLNDNNNPLEVTVNQVGTTDLYDVVVTVTWEQRGRRQLSRTLRTTIWRQ
jgi:prepilin-type N-terminal cleavage/methylation domain-containing protein